MLAFDIISPWTFLVFKGEKSSSNADEREKTEDLLRNFNLRDVSQRKRTVEELSRSNLMKSFGSTDKHQKREGERKDSPPKK